MSLGFNSQRNPRKTNLPGAVGANIIFVAPQRKYVKPNVTRSTKEPVPNTRVEKKETPMVPDDMQEHHFAYATVDGTLLSCDEEVEIFPDGARVVVVYPMRKETDERVSMRVKAINNTTGQLSYTWAIIFDSTKDKRYLKDFSLIP